MMYLTFTFWLLCILLTGRGLYRLWVRAVPQAAVDWVMFPAALVSESAYSIGRLLVGRPAYGAIIGPWDSSADPCRNAISGKHGFAVSMLASGLALLASAGVMLYLGQAFGGGVVRHFVFRFGEFTIARLPSDLPGSWEQFWYVLRYQLFLVQRLCETWGRLDWMTWQPWLFVYGMATFGVRLGPVRHDWRAEFVSAGILVVLVLILCALYAPAGETLAGGVWYLMTYLWATLLLLSACTLVVYLAAGVVRLFQRSGASSGKANARPVKKVSQSAA